MNTAPPFPASQPFPASHPALTLAERFRAIIAPLVLLVAAGFRTLGPLTVPLHARLARAARRLTRLLEALAAGRLPRRRTPGPARPGGPPPAPIPRCHAWLVVTLGHNAAASACQLQSLLHDPATTALLAAAPAAAIASAARTLRPLCRLLGIPLPPALQPPAPPPRPPTPKAPRPKPALLPPLLPLLPPPLPLLPQRRPRDLPFMRLLPTTRPA